MATLAYAVAQSTTNTLMPVKVKPSVGNLKPNGKSYFTASFIQAKYVFDKNKPTGTSAATSLNTTKFIPIIKSNITFGFVNKDNLISTKKISATQWYPTAISFSTSAINNMVAKTKPAIWYPSFVSFSPSAISSMNTGQFKIGSLVTPYLYEKLTLSNLMSSKVSIVNTQFTTPVQPMYNEKMLTLKSGVVSAYGELSRNAGWVN